MVRNKTTKLSMLFALVGSMMIVFPMLTEQVYARTEGFAQTLFGHPPFNIDPPFTNVIGKLTVGKWKVHPIVFNDGHRIDWVTVGSGIFGGDEKGTIDADFGPGRHVTFSWFNPDSNARNTCGIKWTGLIHASCRITSPNGALFGPVAIAKFSVDTACKGRDSGCAENGSVHFP